MNAGHIMVESLARGFENVTLFLQTKVEVARLSEEKKQLQLAQKELEKKKTRLSNEHELLEEYSRSLVDAGKTSKPGKLVETDTLGMLHHFEVVTFYCKLLSTLGIKVYRITCRAKNVNAMCI